MGKDITDSAACAVQVCVAGDNLDTVGQGLFKEPSDGSCGIDCGKRMKDQGMVGYDRIGPPGDGLIQEHVCRIQADQYSGGFRIGMSDKQSDIVPGFSKFEWSDSIKEADDVPNPRCHFRLFGRTGEKDNKKGTIPEEVPLCCSPSELEAQAAVRQKEKVPSVFVDTDKLFKEPAVK